MKVWKPDEVRAELVDAYRVLFAVPVKDRGASSGAGFWPEITYEADEVKEMRAQVIAEGVRLRIRPTPGQIRRMEIILLGEGSSSGWLRTYMADAPALKRVLVAAVLWEAAGSEFKTGCRRRGWAYSTFRRNRDKAAALLAERLTAAGVELP